jgi:MoaA/NifB/PqqE/SkfB family radical SAM enzyme
VSVDGAEATTHDRLRGKAGSFDAALGALALLDELSRRRRAEQSRPVRFGVDCVVVQSNFDELPELVARLSNRFSELEFIIFNAVVPQGLASRESYEAELLTDAQMNRLESDELMATLRARAAGHVRLFTRTNLDLQMHPTLVAEDTAWTLDRLIVEPDGMVRALEVYEGHVGNVLVDPDPPEVLWQRVAERRSHPFVVEQLSNVRTSSEWAAAARKIDRFFASPADLVRINKRSRAPL